MPPLPPWTVLESILTFVRVRVLAAGVQPASLGIAAVAPVAAGAGGLRGAPVTAVASPDNIGDNFSVRESEATRVQVQTTPLSVAAVPPLIGVTAVCLTPIASVATLKRVGGDVHIGKAKTAGAAIQACTSRVAPRATVSHPSKTVGTDIAPTAPYHALLVSATLESLASLVWTSRPPPAALPPAPPLPAKYPNRRGPRQKCSECEKGWAAVAT